MKDWLRHHTLRPSRTWVWNLFRLWECVCGSRFRKRNDLMRHELSCRVDRGYNGQG